MVPSIGDDALGAEFFSDAFYDSTESFFGSDEESSHEIENSFKKQESCYGGR